MHLTRKQYRAELEDKCPERLKLSIMAAFNAWYSDYVEKNEEFGPDYTAVIREIDEDGVWLRPVPAAPSPWK